MEELFGLSMTTLMYVLLVVVLACMIVLGVLAARNRIMLKMGLRPIPRRPGQTILIIMGVMLSTVIIAAAFGTGDTLSHTIRNGAVEWLREIDELIVPTRAGEEARFGVAYLTEERFEDLLTDLSANDKIDGIMPQIAESVSVQSIRTGLSEGRMRLVGIDPAMLSGFQGPSLKDGGEARLEGLTPGEAYVSEHSIDEIEAEVGDDLDVFLEGRSERLKIAGIVSAGGFAGIEPTLLMPLKNAQELLGRPGQINTIVISNRGDSQTGVDLSEDVTMDLRVLFNDRAVAEEIKALFGRQDVLGALDEKVADLEREAGDSDSSDELDNLRVIAEEVRKPELTDELSSLLADPEVTRAVVEQMEDAELDSAAAEAYTLLSELAEFQVVEVKREIIESSEEVGTGVTSIFILFSSFSIMVGILLIFLIFVMLASARKSEMGMARAIGAKRRHLVMMFAFEGTAYAVVSAAIGVVLGLGVSMLMVTVMNQIFSGLDETFTLAIHFEPRSVVVAYCLGMTITFATVAVSAYRVSRLNIVVAIRGLPESILPRSEPPFKDRLVGLLRSVVLPAYHLIAALRALFRLRIRESAKSLGLSAVTALPTSVAYGSRARTSQVHPTVPAEGLAGASCRSGPHLLRCRSVGEVFVVRSGCISQCGGAGTDAEVEAWVDGDADRDRRQDRIYGCGHGHACLLGAAGVRTEATGRRSAGGLRYHVRLRCRHGGRRRMDCDVQLGPAGERAGGADVPVRQDKACAGNGDCLPHELQVPDGIDARYVRLGDLHAGHYVGADQCVHDTVRRAAQGVHGLRRGRVDQLQHARRRHRRGHRRGGGCVGLGLRGGGRRHQRAGRNETERG